MYLVRLWEINSDQPIILEEVTEAQRREIIDSLYEQEIIYFEDHMGDRYINPKNVLQVFVEKIDE